MQPPRPVAGSASWAYHCDLGTSCYSMHSTAQAAAHLSLSNQTTNLSNFPSIHRCLGSCVLVSISQLCTLFWRASAPCPGHDRLITLTICSQGAGAELAASLAAQHLDPLEEVPQADEHSESDSDSDESHAQASLGQDTHFRPGCAYRAEGMHPAVVVHAPAAFTGPSCSTDHRA